MSICFPHVFLCPRLLRAAILPLKHFYGIKMQVQGSEHLNTKEPCVIVCNHQASLDLMGTCKGEEGLITAWAAFGVLQGWTRLTLEGLSEASTRICTGQCGRHRPEELVGQELRAMDVLRREGWDDGR